MNGFIKLAGVLLMTIFILGCFTAGFYTYVIMPRNLLDSLGVGGEANLEHVRSAVFPLLLTVAGELVLGILAVGYYFYDKQNKRSAHIIYVEKTASLKETVENETVADRQQKYREDKASILAELNPEFSPEEQGKQVFMRLCKILEAAAGAFYVREARENVRRLKIYATYAYVTADSDDTGYEFGEGPVGQAAKEGKVIHIQSVPQGYIQVISGLGKSTPDSLLVVPCGRPDDEHLFVAEIARFGKFESEQIRLAEEVLQNFCTEHTPN